MMLDLVKSYGDIIVAELLKSEYNFVVSRDENSDVRSDYIYCRIDVIRPIGLRFVNLTYYSRRESVTATKGEILACGVPSPDEETWVEIVGNGVTYRTENPGLIKRCEMAIKVHLDSIQRRIMGE